ncbi:MAG: hypothetical protein Q8R57_04080 [Bacteroidota bacterium]|nr:hypothetical protein [Bacteroidota bacterium]
MNQITMKWMAGLCFLAILYSLWMLNPRQQISAQKAVYHWKTNFYWSAEPNDVRKFLNAHGIQKLYIKMLDVDYSKASGILPVSKTSFNYYSDYKKDSIEFVPVVYLSNEVFKRMLPQDRDEYAKKVLSHVLRIQTYTHYWPKEIQFDCDWTVDTKEAYFDFIIRCKKWAPQFSYSSTLRLYPYKYREKLGVPPVNRVMLMLYNLQNAKNMANANSLFSLQEALKYLKRKDYPLPMDVALPVFSWTIIFRNGQFYRVISDNIIPKLDSEVQLKPLTNNKFLVEFSPRNFNDYDLKAGDILKVETCGEKELVQANSLLKILPITQASTVALFDLDMNELNKISYEKIEAAFTISR